MPDDHRRAQLREIDADMRAIKTPWLYRAAATLIVLALVGWLALIFGTAGGGLTLLIVLFLPLVLARAVAGIWGYPVHRALTVLTVAWLSVVVFLFGLLLLEPPRGLPPLDTSEPVSFSPAGGEAYFLVYWGEGAEPREWRTVAHRTCTAQSVESLARELDSAPQLTGRTRPPWPSDGATAEAVARAYARFFQNPHDADVERAIYTGCLRGFRGRR